MKKGDHVTQLYSLLSISPTMADGKPTFSSDKTSGSQFSSDTLPHLVFNDSGGNVAVTEPKDKLSALGNEGQSGMCAPDPDMGVRVDFPPSGEEKLQKRKRLLQFLVLCWTFIFEGWSDASLGPLLPSIQEFYGVRSFVILTLR